MPDLLEPLRDAVLAAARNVVELDQEGGSLVAAGHLGQAVAERRLAVLGLRSALVAHDAVKGRLERQKAKAGRSLPPLRMQPDSRSERWRAAERRYVLGPNPVDLRIIKEEQDAWDVAHPETAVDNPDEP